MSLQILFSVIAAMISIGGLCVGFGVLKSKIMQNGSVNDEQTKKIDACATKNELAEVKNVFYDKLTQAIKRSDEMLEMMRKRAEDDRSRGDGQYKEIYGVLTAHAERISALETSQSAITKTLDEIKTDLNGGFKDIRNELKELRN
jgi:hypothetical protein